jgi:YHS domain-containing protein
MKYIHLLFLLFCPVLWAANEPVSTSLFGTTAIGGHDATAYHGLSQGDQAQKGSKKYVVTWKGAEWQFLSEKDSQLFAANPEKYAPAYNGHCANALSLGEGLIKTSGKHWAIFDDQLYLFYASRGTKRWLNGNYKDYKEEADRAWKEILSRNEKHK